KRDRKDQPHLNQQTDQQPKVQREGTQKPKRHTDQSEQPARAVFLLTHPVVEHGTTNNHQQRSVGHGTIFRGAAVKVKPAPALTTDLISHRCSKPPPQPSYQPSGLGSKMGTVVSGALPP